LRRPTCTEWEHGEKKEIGKKVKRLKGEVRKGWSVRKGREKGEGGLNNFFAGGPKFEVTPLSAHT